MRTLLLFFIGFFGREVFLPAVVHAQAPQSSCWRRWRAIGAASDRAWHFAPFHKREAIVDLGGAASAAAENAAKDPQGPLCAEDRLQSAEAVLQVWRAKGWLLPAEDENRFYARKSAEDVDAAIAKAKKEK